VQSYKRHDISDKEWLLISPHLPGQPNQSGGVAKDNRAFINAVCWHIRTGSPWRDLPPCYGNWNSQAKRYRRWVKNGTWAKLHKLFANTSELTCFFIDASHSKVHQHACGAVGGNQDMGRTKGG
jgi:transposase